MPRDYKKEYRDFHAKPKQIKRRAGRNKSRAKMVAAGRVKLGDGKDVHHKDKNPRNTSPKNLSVKSKTANRKKK